MRIKYIAIFFVILVALASGYIYFSNPLYKRLASVSSRVSGVFGIDALHLFTNVLNEVDIIRPVLRWKHSLDKANIVDLILSPSDLKAHREYIQEMKRSGKNDDMNQWRKAKLMLSGKKQKVAYKYHGTSAGPYLRDKFSLKIKHSKSGEYRENLRRYNLIADIEFNPTHIATNNIANELGLIVPRGRMVALNINGVNMGTFYLEESMSKEWLETQHGITLFTVLKTNDGRYRRDTFSHGTDLDFYPGNIEFKGVSQYPGVALGKYQVLAEAVKNKDMQTLMSLFDLDYMARFMAALAITNDVHFVTGDNLRLIYNFSSGLFYPLFRQENSVLGPTSNSPAKFNRMLFYPLASHYHDQKTQEIFKLLLSNDVLREKRDKYLWHLVKNADHLVGLVRKVFAQNRAAMLHSDFPRRNYSYQKYETLRNLQSNIRLAHKYLSYAKVLITLERKARHTVMKIVSDSYVPLTLEKVAYKAKDTKLVTHTVNKQILPIKVGANLQDTHRQISVILNFGGMPEGFQVYNQITGEKVPKQHITVNEITTIAKMNQSDPLQSLRESGVPFTVKGNAINIRSGKHLVRSDVLTPIGMAVHVSAGTTFKIASGRSFVMRGPLQAIGRAESPIVVEAAEKQPFGTFAVLLIENKKSQLAHMKVSGGGEALVNGTYFSGQLALHNTNVDIQHVHIANSSSDDGLNVKNARVTIRDAKFERNAFDQVDLDFCQGEVVNSTFIAAQGSKEGDGLDVSGAHVMVKNNIFIGFGDKGASIGENSKAFLQGNQFKNTATAIAIKDNSTTYSYANEFHGNARHYALYIKKKFFPGAPTLHVENAPKDNKVTATAGEIVIMSKRQAYAEFESR